MLIRNQETGLALPPAPEFGPDSAWPPVATDWVPLRWELFEAHQASFGAATAYILFELCRAFQHDSLPMEDALQEDFLREAVFAQYPQLLMIERREPKAGQAGSLRISIPSEIMKIQQDLSHVTSTAVASLYRSGALGWFELVNELRRLVHSARWRRTDPVTQLPPGSTHEMTHSITTGLSVEHTQALANSLGLSLGTNVGGVQAKLSSQLQQQFGLTLEIAAQEQRSTKLTVTNPSVDHSRLFALWHVDHCVAVHALSIYPSDAPSDAAGLSHGLQPFWVPRGSTEFATDSDPHITYAEVHRA